MIRRAFTLLEVVVALAILAVGLTVLVSSQATAVLMTTETEKIRLATLLANEKMNEALLRVELEGFTDQDIDEEGDYADFGEEDFRGDQSLDVEFGDALQDFRWAYTIRSIELELPPDILGSTGDLVGNGYYGEEAASEYQPQGSTPDLTDFMQPEMITQMLSPYLREVRVLVWWGDNEDGTDQVELLSHVINPTGTVVPGGQSTTGSQQ